MPDIAIDRWPAWGRRKGQVRQLRGKKGAIMNLPWDFSRCVGQTNWSTKEPGEPERLHPTCNGCRRREPGHEHRQVYIAPAIEVPTGFCPNRIAPEAS